MFLISIWLHLQIYCFQFSYHLSEETKPEPVNGSEEKKAEPAATEEKMEA